MEKKLIPFFILFNLLFSFFQANSQIDFKDFEENFDSSSKPDDWTIEYTSGSVNWNYKDGGINSSHPPYSAYEGDYNAVFYKANGSITKTKLISPSIDFEFAIKPVLHFYLAQYYYLDEWGEGNSTLSLYYRSPEINSNNWVWLKDWNDNVDGWEEQILLLPDSVRYSSVQLAFEGRSSKVYEHGTCIDKISIVETGVIPKNLTALTCIQPSTDIIPTGSSNNPILRLKFSVAGNDGNLNVDSLVVNALNDSKDVVSAKGVKLFATTVDRFNDTTPIAAGVSIINGKASFSNIQYDLPVGNSYIWVTYDVPYDVNHEFKGKVLDASISINNIKINNEYWPSSIMNPSGTRLVNESLFFDNFENEVLWDLVGEFEIDTPMGLGGYRPEPDPTYARSGKRVMGTDITGLNDFPGDYERNLASKAYMATADTIFTAKYYKDIQLAFYRWLNIYYKDTASIEISLDGGTNWEPIWKNTTAFLDNKWNFKQINLSQTADRSDQLALRFTLGPTDISPYSGWNIDNVALTGTFVNDDIGILALNTLNSGCGHDAPEAVEVVVKNYGYSATSDTLPLGYSLDGGTTWVIDTLFQSIAQEGTVTFTFSELADLTTPDEYSVVIKTMYEDDEDDRNDELSTTVYSLPTYTLPYAQDFNSSSGSWRSLGNGSWEYGTPDKSIIKSAYSGSNCWVTLLDDDYPNNDSSWLESPCFNFSDAVVPVFECMIWADAEPNKDGLALYYSTNDGSSWTLVPTNTSYSYSWNWYNNSAISSLGTEGFDSTDNSWFKTRQILPGTLAGESSVKFRLLFTSNDTISDEGFAIDDIKIYDSPIDAGVTAITNPVSSCYLSSDQTFTARIKNYGIRPIKITEPIYASIKVNNQLVSTDTFYCSSPIAIGAYEDFTFSGTVDLTDKGIYNILCYTNVPGDTSYYVPNDYNDTLITSVSVLAETNYSLGADIGTLMPDTVTLDAGAGYSSYTWLDHENNSTTIGRYLNVPDFDIGVKEINFSVIVQNSNGCLMYDTIKVIKSTSDLGVSAIAGMSDACLNAQSGNSLTATVTNFSADTTYSATAVLSVGYMYNETVHIESFTTGTILGENETINYTFTQPPVFSDSGTYELKVFSVVNADIIYTNDTAYQSITIHPTPNVNIGEDTIYTTTAITTIGTFDATDPIFDSYKWQDNSTNSTYTITTNETYTYYVEVEDIYNCGTSTDTVHVIADNWKIGDYVSPVSSCTLTSSEKVSFKVQNSSPNTYLAGEKIKANITFNSITYADSFYLTADLTPSSIFTYTSSKSFNLSSVKSYTFKIVLTPENDINYNDNTISKTISVWGVNPVELGVDSVVTQRADTIILDAGSGYSTYFWSTGSFDQTLNIPTNESATYTVSVTSAHGCSNSTDTVKIIAYDIGISEINLPKSQCTLTSTDRIRATLYNYGPDILPAGEELTFYYEINSSNWEAISYTTVVPIDPGETGSVILFKNITLNSSSTYNMKMYVRWDKDYYPENDTAYTTVYQYPNTTVSLGDDIITSRPDTLVIDAGSGQTTYLWNDGSTSQTFPVTHNYTDTYTVTVTNSYGCTASDNIKVITYDINTSTTGGNTNICNTGSQYISIDVELNSNDTILPNEGIKAWYKFNDLDSVLETIVLTDTLLQSKPLSYTFYTPLNISDTGNFSLTTFASYSYESNLSNNYDSSDFRVGAIPVQLGNDIITYDYPYTIDAGSGYDGYIWNDNSTSQTLDVYATGTYSVTTTDTNSCTANDDVHITIITPDYVVSKLVGVTNTCEHSSSQTLTFTLLNNGNDTLRIGTGLEMTYSINADTAETETYTIPENLTPGLSVNIPFTQKINISAAGSYSININIKVEDIETDNTFEVTTWSLPDIDLGENVSTTLNQYTIDAGSGYSSYLWNTNEITQTITVTDDGTYTVTITNEYGCENSDQVYIKFLPYALDVTELISPIEGCMPLNTESPYIRVKNVGTKELPANTTLSLAYQIDGGTRINENVEIASKMVPEAILNYEFKHNLNITQSGNVNISFYVNLESIDLDTSVFTINVLPAYVFSFSGDTIQVEGFPYTLNPNVTADAYLWNTGATTPTISVQNAGNYQLTTTNNTNSCTYTDTVYIMQGNSIFDDWGKQISIYPNPTSKEIFVKIPDNINNSIIEITSNSGQEIFRTDETETINRINVSHWSPGVYIVRIYDNTHIAQFKIIKE